jgi:DNA (cytosine-5)-methyltransferase 3A
VKPAFFLLENVTMKKEWRDIITEAVGVEPVFINSSCLSAQSRPRWYWTDIPRVVLPPPDLGLTLADILEKPLHDDAVSQPMRTKTGKAYYLTATYGNCGSKGVPYPSEIAHNLERHQRTCIIGRAGKLNYGQAERVYSTKSVSPTLLTSYPPKIGVATYSGEKPKPSPCPHLSKLPVIEEHAWRMLTPVECERLQTLDDGYTACLSDKQRYKAIGNGWTVDVIAYLLGGIA